MPLNEETKPNQEWLWHLIPHEGWYTIKHPPQKKHYSRQSTEEGESVWIKEN